ncbi:MAG: hypothetical protein R6W76_12615, partial [Caldilinea sp.]
MNKRILLATLALLAVALFVVAGCAAPATTSTAPAATSGEAQPAADVVADTLVIAISEDTASLDPGRAFETLPSIIHKATYQTLVTFPPDSVESVIPGLASAWDISEDGLVYTFTLDENARGPLHDITAEIVEVRNGWFERPASETRLSALVARFHDALQQFLSDRLVERQQLYLPGDRRYVLAPRFELEPGTRLECRHQGFVLPSALGRVLDRPGDRPPAAAGPQRGG